MLARRRGVDYSQGIQFETIIINMEEAQELTMKNQQKKATKAVPVWLHQALTGYFKGLPCGACNYKGQNIGLGGFDIEIQIKEGRIRCSCRGR